MNDGSHFQRVLEREREGARLLSSLSGTRNPIKFSFRGNRKQKTSQLMRVKKEVTNMLMIAPSMSRA